MVRVQPLTSAQTLPFLIRATSPNGIPVRGRPDPMIRVRVEQAGWPPEVAAVAASYGLQLPNPVPSFDEVMAETNTVAGHCTRIPHTDVGLKQRTPQVKPVVFDLQSSPPVYLNL